MIDVVLGKEQITYVRHDEEIIGYIAAQDGEIILNRFTNLSEFSDDDLLLLMKIGMKPGLFYGENSIWNKRARGELK